MLKSWRLAQGKSQAECAQALGLEGGARSFQRIETGENKPDADIVERIVHLTGGSVTAEAMHCVRLAWLRANRPDKFPDAPQDADRVATAPSAAPSAAGGAFSHEVAG